jgi:hypothetical protein
METEAKTTDPSSVFIFDDQDSPSEEEDSDGARRFLRSGNLRGLDA